MERDILEHGRFERGTNGFSGKRKSDTEPTVPGIQPRIAEEIVETRALPFCDLDPETKLMYLDAMTNKIKNVCKDVKWELNSSKQGQ